MTDIISVSPVAPNQGLKSFIFGKVWINSPESNRPGTASVSRSLPTEITLKAGMTFALHLNTKREGKNDADYSMSILLPTETVDKLIEVEKVNASKLNLEASNTDSVPM